MKAKPQPAKPPRKAKTPPKLTFLEHFQELKSRLATWLVVFLAASLLGYILRDRLLALLLSPLQRPLYYSSPAGGFSFVFSLSLFFGFLTSIPVLVYELLGFIGPAVPHRVQQSALVILVSSSLLMIAGIAFAYFASLPAALIFLSKFGGSEVRSLISTSEYFSFVTRYLIGFGLLFQLPLVMYFINKIKRLQVHRLLGFERWVLVISFIMAAAITPTPDIINQTVMAVPMILLYQVSVLIVWMVNRHKT